MMLLKSGEPYWDHPNRRKKRCGSADVSAWLPSTEMKLNQEGSRPDFRKIEGVLSVSQAPDKGLNDLSPR